MEICPVCKAKVEDPTAKECPKCGVIFEKWQAKVAAAVIALDRPQGERKKGKPKHLALLFLIVLCFSAAWGCLFFMSLQSKKKVDPADRNSGEVTAVLPSDPTPEATVPMPEGTDPVPPSP